MLTARFVSNYRRANGNSGKIYSITPTAKTAAEVNEYIASKKLEGYYRASDEGLPLFMLPDFDRFGNRVFAGETINLARVVNPDTETIRFYYDTSAEEKALDLQIKASMVVEAGKLAAAAYMKKQTVNAAPQPQPQPQPEKQDEDKKDDTFKEDKVLSGLTGNGSEDIGG